MCVLLEERPVDLRRQKRAFVLGIRGVGEPHAAKFLGAAAPNRGHEIGVGVAREEVERRGFAPLLPHEEHGRPGRAKNRIAATSLCRPGDAILERRRPCHAFGDLIVISDEHAEFVTGLACRRFAVVFAAVGAYLPS